MVKNPPANAGDVQGRKIDPEDGEGPLEEGIAIHFNILAWKIL